MEAKIKMIPIQITDEGVFIPKFYLRKTDNFELVIEDESIFVRPQTTALPENHDKLLSSKPEPSKLTRRFSFMGIGQTRNPKAPVEAQHHADFDC